MGEYSAIEWTDHTFNPWIGCTKISAGCLNCYAEKFGKRFGVKWGAREARRATSAGYWKKPIAWDKNAQKEEIREKVFCGSLCDVFEMNYGSNHFRKQLFDLIEATPSLDWLLLTKRAENMARFFEGIPVPPNVWLGVSAENQKALNERLPHLFSIEAPCLFVSLEPLIGPILFEDACDEWWTSQYRPFWVIAGGESGAKARHMKIEWIRSIRDQCMDHGVPFFFKQWDQPRKKLYGTQLDGREWREFPG